MLCLLLVQETWPGFAASTQCKEERSDSSLQGFKRMGFSREAGKTIYREWVPTARAVGLIGDFNEWQPYWLEAKDFGVWEIELPGEFGGKKVSYPAHSSQLTSRVILLRY